jgi:Abnormal spindle-like microcephaly-assoc'd, ASPM-SPD-2-Hydin/Viral BACON domain
LLLDNEVIVRYTGPAAVTQISVEQPTGTALTDAASTVAYGSIANGATLSKSFTIRNNGTTALTISGATIDGTNLTNFTVSTPPASSIVAGGSTIMNVSFTPTTAGSKTAALHIASSDSSVGAAFDINLTGTGTTAAPTINFIAATPGAPTNTESPWINAKILAGSGSTIASAQLSYNGGASATTATVFTETMAATATAAMAGWTGTGSDNPWSVTNTGGLGNVKQTTAANHGSGNLCGLDMNGGSATATNTMVTTTNVINAVGTSGYVEFWVATSNLAAGLGWNFQLTTDGTTWNTRASELTGTNHGYVTVYHYDLLATERVNTLKMRFQFIGNNTGGPTSPSVQIDDIKVVTTSGSAAVTLSMFDDGAHNDGAAGDGVYGVKIPALPTGTVVSYTIAATDNNSTTTTSGIGTYLVGAITPVLAVTPASGLTVSGAVGGVFSPSGATYTLTNSGSGPMNWTVSKTAAWLALSTSSGSLAAGASTTVTATINTAANSLSASSYADTITFTNSSNGNGNTTRAVALTVTAGPSIAPITLHMQFNGVVGINYILQYSPDLTVGSWIAIGSVGSDGNFTETNASRLALSKGFYRVVTP